MSLLLKSLTRLNSRPMAVESASDEASPVAVSLAAVSPEAVSPAAAPSTVELTSSVETVASQIDALLGSVEETDLGGSPSPKLDTLSYDLLSPDFNTAEPLSFEPLSAELLPAEAILPEAQAAEPMSPESRIFESRPTEIRFRPEASRSPKIETPSPPSTPATGPRAVIEPLPSLGDVPVDVEDFSQPIAERATIHLSSSGGLHNALERLLAVDLVRKPELTLDVPEPISPSVQLPEPPLAAAPVALPAALPAPLAVSPPLTPLEKIFDTPRAAAPLAIPAAVAAEVAALPLISPPAPAPVTPPAMAPEMPPAEPPIAQPAALPVKLSIELPAMLQPADRSKTALPDVSVAAGSPTVRHEYRELCNHLLARFKLKPHSTLLFVDAGQMLTDASWLLPLAVSLLEHLPAQAQLDDSPSNKAGRPAALPRILLVEAAGANCELARSMGLEPDQGLSEILRGNLACSAALQATLHPQIQLLSSGIGPLKPHQLTRLPALWSELKEQFDLLLVAAGPVADAASNSSSYLRSPANSFFTLADAAVLCLELNGTAQWAAQRAAHALTAGGVNVVGCVVRG